jgi:hypothetical protein
VIEAKGGSMEWITRTPIFHEQSQRRIPRRFQWEQTLEQIRHNPFTTSPRMASDTPRQSELICSATEREFEGVRLSEPPFRFSQQWDQDTDHFFGQEQDKGDGWL